MLNPVGLRSAGLRYIGFALVIVSIIFLILGITLPCITVSGQLFNLIPIGSEKKSILGVIVSLYNRNIVLAILLTLFSVIIPITKLVLTIIMMIGKSKNSNQLLPIFMHHIGKWSMVDVFSVAIIVSMLTFDNLKIKIFSTEGQILPGFYFFLSYGILSILTSYFVKKHPEITS